MKLIFKVMQKNENECHYIYNNTIMFKKNKNSIDCYENNDDLKNR